MTTTKEMIDTMQAHIDGKQIQFCDYDNNWKDCTCKPHWNWADVNYRVKPEKKTKEIFIQMRDSILDLLQGKCCYSTSLEFQYTKKVTLTWEE